MPAAVNVPPSSGEPAAAAAPGPEKDQPREPFNLDEILRSETLPPRSIPPAIPGASITETLAAIEGFLAETEGIVGFELLRPGAGLVLQHNAASALPLASVVKVPLLLAYLDALEGENRPPTEEEIYLFEDMIRLSDNWAAQLLWDALGGVERLFPYLERSGFEPHLDGYDSEWGETALSAHEVSRLLWELYQGRLLNEDDTAFALNLLAKVDIDQRWGVTAGLDDEQVQVFIKDGWYPADDESGWRMNSAAIIRPPDGVPYVLVILTDQQPTYEYGRETVETVAALLNAMLAIPASR